MANGKSAQVQFPFQRPATGVYRVGPVGSGMVFTSIQTAISQAVTDGFTSNDNPATIEIYPGTYTEDLTLASGVHLKGIGSNIRNISEVVIVGTLTYTPGAGTLVTNIINLFDLTVAPAAAAKAFVFSGTNPGRIRANNVLFSSNSGGAGVTGLVTVSNSGASSDFILTDCAIQSNNVLDTELLQATAATTQFFGGSGGLTNNSGGTIATGISAAGTATVNARMNGFVAGAFTQIFTIGATTALVQCLSANVQNTLNGGHIFNFTAAGTARAHASGLFTNNLAGKIANGAAGTLYLSMCRFGGTTALPNAQIDSGITSVTTGQSGVESDQIYKEYQVGRGMGFQTIQAAITAAAASASGARKVVKIAPGTYTESLTLSPNVDLVADSYDLANNVGSPVIILGVHTFASTGANDSVNLTGIRFISSVAGGNPSATALFGLSGATAGVQVKFTNCTFSKTFAGTANMISLTSSGLNYTVILDNCLVAYAADGGSMIDCSGASNAPVVVLRKQLGAKGVLSNPGSGYSIAQQTGASPVSVQLLTTPAAGGMYFEACQINVEASSTRLIVINTNLDQIFMEHCKIKQVVDDGVMFKFLAAGIANLSGCILDLNRGALLNGNPLLADDNGTHATGTLTISATPTAGATITINGVTFTEGVEWSNVGTTSQIADSIRNAVNNSTNGSIFVKLYATTAANVVTIKAFFNNVAYALATSDAGNIVLSGAALAGGVAGAGGSWRNATNTVYRALAGGNQSGCVVGGNLTSTTYLSNNVSNTP